METKVICVGVKQEKEISRKETPDFLLLYEQSVLISLKEQGILNEFQLQLCLDELSKLFLKAH